MYLSYDLEKIIEDKMIIRNFVWKLVFFLIVSTYLIFRFFIVF